MGLIYKTCFILALFYTVTFSFSLPELISSPFNLNADKKSKEFKGKKLYDYIDGEADIYFKYGFKNCLTRSYSGQNEILLEVNLYDLGSAKNAKGLFKEFNTGEKIYSDIGDGLFIGQRYSYLIKDRYFIEIVDRSKDKLLDINYLDISKKFLINLKKN